MDDISISVRLRLTRTEMVACGEEFLVAGYAVFENEHGDGLDGEEFLLFALSDEEIESYEEGIK